MAAKTGEKCGISVSKAAAGVKWRYPASRNIARNGSIEKKRWQQSENAKKQRHQHGANGENS